MIYEHDSVSSFLKSELRTRVQINPNYSLRSFAKSLGLSPGALSEILNERRSLSLKAVKKVAQGLALSQSEVRELVELIQLSKADRAKREMNIITSHYSKNRIVKEEVFSLISEWYHFAILNLIDCKDFKWEAQWISSRLAISRTQAKSAMDLLEKLKIVQVFKSGVKVDASHIETLKDIPSEAVRSYHKQILEKAIVSLSNQNIEDREISGVGFAINPKKIPSLKKEIIEFQDRVLSKYSKGNKTKVYFLEMALFELTNGEEK